MTTSAFTFNGVDLGAYLYAEKINRPLTAGQSHVTTQVPGMRGVLFHRTQTAQRTVSFQVSWVGSSHANAATIRQTIASLLITSLPAALVYPDEPNLVLWAKLSGETNLDQIGTMRRGVITFDCFDPDSQYATEDATSISSTGGASGGSVTTVNNQGNLATWPREEFTLDGDATFVDVLHVESGRHLLIGTPDSSTAPPVAPTTLLLNGNCTTTSGWGVSGTAVDGGNTAGAAGASFAVNPGGTALGAQYTGGSYGTNVGTAPNLWHGPRMGLSL